MGSPSARRRADRPGWSRGALVALVLVACGPPERPAPQPSDELRAVSGRSYLIESLGVDAPVMVDGERSVPGFDVDGVDSGEGSRERDATCAELRPDGRSTLDPTLTGVDDALADLLGAIRSITGSELDDDLAAATGGGASRIAFELAAIPPGTGPHEPEVTLWLVRADETIARDGDRVIAGQTLRAARLGTLAARARASTLTTYGTLVSGFVFELAPVSFLDFDVFTLAVLGIDATSGADRLRGQLGGYFELDGSVQRVLDVVMDPSAEPVVRQVLESVADLLPRASEPRRCARISAGFRFEAVPVEIVDDGSPPP